MVLVCCWKHSLIQVIYSMLQYVIICQNLNVVLYFGCDNGTAIGDSPEIPCCCDGASTAVVHKSKVLALNLADCAVLGDTDMGAMDNKTETVVGHVGYHGAETGDSREGEARQATEGEVVAIYPAEVIFEATCELVAT